MTVQVEPTIDKEQIYELINRRPGRSAVFLPQSRRTMAGLALAEWLSGCHQGGSRNTLYDQNTRTRLPPSHG